MHPVHRAPSLEYSGLFSHLTLTNPSLLYKLVAGGSAQIITVLFVGSESNDQEILTPGRHYSSCYTHTFPVLPNNPLSGWDEVLHKAALYLRIAYAANNLSQSTIQLHLHWSHGLIAEATKDKVKQAQRSAS